ncbi:MAG: EAL domain-containing protein, partial [Pseudomonadota bacterium]
HWKKVIGTYLPISVNISAQRLIDQNLVRRLENIQVPAKYITFELTETIYFDGVFEKLIETIEAVKSTGIHIEIDDFGTGHASILSLQRIRPRRLKIARELISPMTQSESQQNLVKTIVDLGRSLNIEIIAEGVETMDQADLLKDMGCHIFQGYAFARPMPRESITKTLLTQSQTLPEEGTPSLGSSVA